MEHITRKTCFDNESVPDLALSDKLLKRIEKLEKEVKELKRDNALLKSQQ